MALHVVTGAFGFSGRYITERLLERGHTVRTLTNSPGRANPFGGRVEAYPLSFEDPGSLAMALEGAEVLHNTYWVRFNHGEMTHASAVANTLCLFNAARRAAVKRVVHVSITNPSLDSRLEYFSGKARLETALEESGLSFAILRPAVLFGPEDILINNIAWALRRLPIFGVFGDGEYRLQPIFVGDLARLAVDQSETANDVVVDAIGPETFTFRRLVEAIGTATGHRRMIVSVPPTLGYFVASVIGRLVRDRFLTREEIQGLMEDRLCTNSPPTGEVRLTDWVNENASVIGTRYASELGRRRNRTDPYHAIS